MPGYTRAYIREALNVSDGTAKVHIAHVYAKLGIHHKDDLLGCIICCNIELIKRRSCSRRSSGPSPFLQGLLE